MYARECRSGMGVAPINNYTYNLDFYRLTLQLVPRGTVADKFRIRSPVGDPNKSVFSEFEGQPTSLERLRTVRPPKN